MQQPAKISSPRSPTDISVVIGTPRPALTAWVLTHGMGTTEERDGRGGRRH